MRTFTISMVLIFALSASSQAQRGTGFHKGNLPEGTDAINYFKGWVKTLTPKMDKIYAQKLGTDKWRVIKSGDGIFTICKAPKGYMNHGITRDTVVFHQPLKEGAECICWAMDQQTVPEPVVKIEDMCLNPTIKCDPKDRWQETVTNADGSKDVYWVNQCQERKLKEHIPAPTTPPAPEKGKTDAEEWKDGDEDKEPKPEKKGMEIRGLVTTTAPARTMSVLTVHAVPPRTMTVSPAVTAVPETQTVITRELTQAGRRFLTIGLPIIAGSAIATLTPLLITKPWQDNPVVVVPPNNPPTGSSSSGGLGGNGPNGSTTIGGRQASPGSIMQLRAAMMRSR